MTNKIKNKDKLDILNELVADVERSKVLMSTDEFIMSDVESQLEHIRDINDKRAKIEKLNDEINTLIEYAPDISDKLYLTEIVDIEKPQFGSNNLILAPVGSGKSTLIKDRLIVNESKTVLMLVSNSALKDNMAPDDNEARKTLSNRMFTTQNKTVYGDKLYRIHLMTYSEFGERVYVDSDFLVDIEQIFCDEIHSLPEYIKYGTKSNGGLIHAQRILFNEQEGKQIFYFTATRQNLDVMEKDRPGTLDVVKTFDYRKHPDIRRYVARSTREITHIEQARQYLRDRKDGFSYYGYKGMAFSRTINSLKSIEQLVVEEGFNPLVLWSDNNEDHLMDATQLAARDILLATNKIPEPYNFLIFNSALQEGWDLKDSSVKLAIMNTTNETELIQSLGRLRRDVDLLVYRTKKRVINADVDIPSKYLNRPLNTKQKKNLCDEMNVIGYEGKPVKWTTLKTLMIEEGYSVQDKQIRNNGKRVKVSVITIE